MRTLRKSSYLSIGELKILKDNLIYIDKDLSEELKDWIETVNHGEYLSNILNDINCNRLLNLQKDWKLL